MSNILTVNPWTLDGSSLNTVLVTTFIKIHHFEFAGYNNYTASKVKLADRYGNPVWIASGAQDNGEVRSGQVGWTEGLQELQHTDGYVLVYIEG